MSYFETSNDIREKTDNHLRLHSPITFSLIRVHDETYSQFEERD